jgi:two-component system phosphate regulon sensor histidine kinase PhoR
MISSLKKTIIFFLIIAILPTIIFSIYQIGTLRENEKVIESIYRNQLDAILFSVNQYSEDVISNWAGRINGVLIEPSNNNQDALNGLIKEFSAVNLFIQFDVNLKPIALAPDCSGPDSIVDKVAKLIARNKSTIKKLHAYLNGGYRKIQSFDLDTNGLQLIIFLSDLSNIKFINALVLDPNRFINEVLDPKMQEIAQNKFYISAFYKTADNIVYSSEKQYAPKVITHNKPFWLLNNYFLAIELKDSTISELAQTRSKRNIYLMAFIDFVLLTGIGLIYRNVKKQMELSQLKSDFVSNVSHEIRTPLALINMYIETLEMGRVNSKEKVKEYYDIILHETQRLSGIVNKILNFSQIESGKRKYSFNNVDINTIVEKVSSTFKINLENNGFKYTLDCMPDIPQIPVDPEAITDALVNLIDNAIKYSADNKEITLRTGNLKDAVFIEVEDRGIGISEKEQKHIFDKFYRVTEKNLALKAKGSGLGLAIVKHIMDAHKGQIIVKSEKGKGSVFRLIFPGQ